MIRKQLWIFSVVVLLGGVGVFAAESATTQVASPNAKAYAVGEMLASDTFDADLSAWKVELENGGRVEAKGGVLTMDVPRGCTVWLKKELEGAVMIRYEARMVKGEAGGAKGVNDRVSDMNAFWMATDTRNLKDFFGVAERTGKFETYNQLKTYYVGQGGNTNTTTRFRRYIGDATNRPLLPEHDLTDAKDLLTANVWQTVELVACGGLVEYYRDGVRVFTYQDKEPYTKGYFGFRTTFNHEEVRGFAVYRLVAKGGG